MEFAPRKLLHRRIVRGMLVVLILQAALICVIALLFQGPWRVINRDTHGAMFARTAAQSLESQPMDQAIASHPTWLRFADQPEVRFVAIVDSQGRVVVHQSKQTDDWNAYATQWMTRANASSDGSSTSAIPWRSLVVHTVPLNVNQPTADQHRLIVGLSDVGAVGSVMDATVAAGLGVVIMMLIALPIFTSMVRRKTEGLRDLMKAIRTIAEGGKLHPLAVRDNGEMGYLAVAFNDMASRLLASRQQLLDANSRLEERVEARTRELASATDKLDQLASTDSLTGLANRRAWNIEMERRFVAAVHDDKEMTCIAIDLDCFKEVNDTLGHHRGDEVLRAASNAIKQNLRGDDFSARLGGDEFVVLLRIDDPKIAEEIAARIQSQFQSACAPIVHDTQLPNPPSLSFGMAMRKDTGARTAEELLIFADRALYLAKDAGRACFRQFIASSEAA